MAPSGGKFAAEHFINRELSWLEFNARVLEEAEDTSTPLLERVKFLAIFSSNLDEFFMVRVAGLREQAFDGTAPQDVAADGLRAITQLEQISKRTRELVTAQYACWNDSIFPELLAEGIRILHHDDLDDSQRKILDKFFRQRAFPILTPMAIDPSHPSPRFHNRGLYLAALLERSSGFGPEQLFAVVQLPQVLPRLVNVVADETCYVLLEDVIAARLPDLFGGYRIVDHATFRVTRDMDVDLLEQEGDDMLRAIEARLRARQRSDAVRLEVSAGMNPDLLHMLISQEGIVEQAPSPSSDYGEVYHIDGLLDMTSLFELSRITDRADLCDPPFVPRQPIGLRPTDDLFAEIAERDILLHHPFDSFEPVVDFIQRAARDPDVLAIKQTLYRTSGDSPIVRALIEAAENGKHVTALVELKARFDEANNIIWARQMERAGVHVVYGFMDMKTHCKLAMVVRQEGRKVRRYCHLGTGNYHPATARIYTDFGLFTSSKVIADDVSALFNFLTGYSQGHRWQKLVIAPNDLQQRTIELIDEQTKRASAGKKARIFAKLNALVDKQTIEALYRASQAGVPVELVVRGICCLRPGLPGISDNIQVRSIVDRFLEHTRIFVFGQGNSQRVYLSSADWMPRNFERRVEVMFPIDAPDLRSQILKKIIPAYMRDNARARILRSDGTYVRATPSRGQDRHRSQVELVNAVVPKMQESEPTLASGDGSNGAAKPSTRQKAK